jgi:hypothetical protein
MEFTLIETAAAVQRRSSILVIMGEKDDSEEPIGSNFTTPMGSETFRG